ncbi:hypothetical protein [Flavobacterium macacae]|uniref:Zf-HC2 domain-containing protein n=1 Tax=Flavobacterium macacae TaxID=2488993 RepID=A0A3P3W6M8_9FLAO|nr:hypothetical protein [Flavobacterium macacae]RRJ90845.1 hypothetical protein EG849_10080 [Flavobacterium macacae]
MKNLTDQEKGDMLDNCKKATFLIEKQQSGKIGFKEKLELEYHLSICEMCNTFMKQSAAINQFVKKVFQRGKTVKLDDGFKAELQKQIDAKLDQPSKN